MTEPMNATDAVNVLKFLERQIESGFGSPESAASLQRVVDHLKGEVSRLVLAHDRAERGVPSTEPAALSFRDQALLAALPVAAIRVPFVGSGDEMLRKFVSDLTVLSFHIADAIEAHRL